jgi:hypothetical protein
VDTYIIPLVEPVDARIPLVESVDTYIIPLVEPVDTYIIHGTIIKKNIKL